MSFFRGAELEKQRHEIAQADVRLEAALKAQEESSRLRSEAHKELCVVLEALAEDSQEHGKTKAECLARISSDALPSVEEKSDPSKAETKPDWRVRLA